MEGKPVREALLNMLYFSQAYYASCYLNHWITPLLMDSGLQQTPLALFAQHLLSPGDGKYLLMRTAPFPHANHVPLQTLPLWPNLTDPKISKRRKLGPEFWTWVMGQSTSGEWSHELGGAASSHASCLVEEACLQGRTPVPPKLQLSPKVCLIYLSFNCVQGSIISICLW